MISRFLKIISLISIASLIVILVVFSYWDIPVKQQQIEIEQDSGKFIK